jgi:methionyl-tRNA synthetase
VGHLAGNYISADVFARFNRQKGNLTLMVSGSDCHGTPILNAAESEGLSPEQIVEKYHKKQLDLFRKFGITYDNYTKTSREHHKEKAQEIFKALYDKGYMQEKTEEQLFDEKAGRFLPDRYVEGKCPHCGFSPARGDQCDNCGKTLVPTELIDPVSKLTGTKPILKEATHLYYDLGKFGPQLKKWLEKQDHWRQNVRNFALGWVNEGLHETPVTRDLQWGVPVPIKGYENKVMYVWFEAVMGYLTATIEWAKLNAGTLKYDDLDENNIFVPSEDPEVKELGENAWELFFKRPETKTYYFIGKDNIPFHTIQWPSILLGYDESLNLPYDVPANQYLNLSKGEKMSKSRGTFIKAADLLEKYDVDTIRYYVAKSLPEFHDTEFSYDDLIDANNSDLVGKLGNFVNRVFVFSAKNFAENVPEGSLDPKVLAEINSAFEEADKFIGEVKLTQGLSRIFKLAQFANQYFDSEKPWETVKDDKTKAANTLYNCFQLIGALGTLLYPYLPTSAAKIGDSVGVDVSTKREFVQLDSGAKFVPIDLLFKKIEPASDDDKK